MMDFPPLHLEPPQTTHTHTAILLHGRGSNGPEFAEELFSSKTSRANNLPECLPTWRWVFPTARYRWAAAFEEEICAWFDAYSLTDIQERQELQIEGLRESVARILGILEAEIALLDGDASRVYLGGYQPGQQARQVLEEVVDHLEWLEYSQAENEGHWIKEPEGFDRILVFLEAASGDE
ncbi:hypothetical protein BJY01DRAFT_221734 [Aspergillus pseudoustus]|uniref:Phospholipase/carboxylesterase/thioesterase domain-containing protein n=1 Tax=Aspergillus pseudoustus TaxID=1810923 RepID=A0ABR4J9D6_9EURO